MLLISHDRQPVIAVDCHHTGGGRCPERTLRSALDAGLVREDLKSAERDELIKRHGHKAMDYHE